YPQVTCNRRDMHRRLIDHQFEHSMRHGCPRSNTLKQCGGRGVRVSVSQVAVSERFVPARVSEVSYGVSPGNSMLDSLKRGDVTAGDSQGLQRSGWLIGRVTAGEPLSLWLGHGAHVASSRRRGLDFYRA